MNMQFYIKSPLLCLLYRFSCRFLLDFRIDSSSLVDSLQGKEIIEYYLRELEEEGITYVPRWTPRVVPGNGRPQLPPPSSARAIPVKGAKNGPDSKDLAELAVGTPDGRSPLTCHYSVSLFKVLFFAGKTNDTR